MHPESFLIILTSVQVTLEAQVYSEMKNKHSKGGQCAAVYLIPARFVISDLIGNRYG